MRVVFSARCGGVELGGGGAGDAVETGSLDSDSDNSARNILQKDLKYSRIYLFGSNKTFTLMLLDSSGEYLLAALCDMVVTEDDSSSSCCCCC